MLGRPAYGPAPGPPHLRERFTRVRARGSSRREGALVRLDYPGSFQAAWKPPACKVIRLRGWYMVDSRRRAFSGIGGVAVKSPWVSTGCAFLHLDVLHRALVYRACHAPVRVGESAVRVPAERQHAPCRAPLRYRQSAPVHEHVVFAARFAAIGGIRRPRLLRAALGADADAVRFLLSATADMQDSEKYFRGRAR